MAKRVQINTFESFDKYTKAIDPKGPPVLLYFSGSKLDSGNSWCPDCVQAEPIVKNFIDQLKDEVIFVYVDVGNREYWKNKDCPYRTDDRSKLMVIPTIFRWKGVQRLEGGQCNKIELLRMLLENED